MRLLSSLGLLTLLTTLGAGCGSVTPDEGSVAEPSPSPEVEVQVEAPAAPIAQGLYALDVETLEGEPQALSEYAGKVTLVVNVASKCGYTPQYAGLQELQSRLEDRGFTVLAFPSNEFRGQEPGDAAEIRAFCTESYGVTFPLFEKCLTQPGDGQSPVYAYLEAEAGAVPSWNFCKYLVGKDGTPTAFFESRVAPNDPELVAAIEAALAAR